MTKQIAPTKPLSFEERTANAARIKAEYLEVERQKVQGRKPEPWRPFLNDGLAWPRRRSDWGPV
jgi:hypothetical protein